MNDFLDGVIDAEFESIQNETAFTSSTVQWHRRQMLLLAIIARRLGRSE